MPLSIAPALLVASVLAADQSAEPAAVAIADDAPAFKLSLSLEAWFPRLEGEFTDGPADVDVRTPDLHDSEPSFAGALAFRQDRLEVALRGFAFATDGGGAADTAFELGGLAVDAGDAFTADFSWWSVGAEVTYDFYRPLAEQPTPWGEPRAGWKPAANATDLSVFLLVSADLNQFERTLANLDTGFSTDANETFASLAVGVGFRLSFDTKPSMPLIRRIDLGAKAAYGAHLAFGGGDGGTGGRIEADIHAHFSEQLSAYFGYRYSGGGFEGEDMTLDGSLQGIRGGIRFEF
jgi:hypothetical protein